MATDTYSTPGADTWTVPSGVTSVVIECWGGGGGGHDGTGGRGGTGGGGGAYSLATVSVTPGDIYSLTVGAGGTGSSTPTAGGDSSVSSPAPAVVCLAKGGAAGTSTSTGSAGGAAASGTGDTKYSGGSSGNQDGDEGGSGGGSSAGTGSGGNNGSPNSGTTGGAGGAAPTGGGAGGRGEDGGGSGRASGSAPGGGGGGGCEGSGDDTVGNGGNGKVTFTYTASGGLPPDYPPAQEGQWLGGGSWNRRRKIPSGRGGAFMEWFDPLFTNPEQVTIDRFAPNYPNIIWGKAWRPEGGLAYTEVPVEPDVVEHGWEFWMPQIQRRYRDRYSRMYGSTLVPQVQDPTTTSYLTIIGESEIIPTYRGPNGVRPSYAGESGLNTEGE